MRILKGSAEMSRHAQFGLTNPNCLPPKTHNACQSGRNMEWGSYLVTDTYANKNL